MRTFQCLYQGKYITSFYDLAIQRIILVSIKTGEIWESDFMCNEYYTRNGLQVATV